MHIHNYYINFEEEGEYVIARRGKIKTNLQGKMYLELYEVEGYEDKKLKIKINDYISNTLQNLRCAYVKVICKDATKNFVDVREVERSTSHSCDDDVIEYLDNLIYEKEEELDILYEVRDRVC